MNRRLIIRPEAESDIIDAAVWYESREAGLGLEVTAEIRAAIKRAVDYPRAHLLLRKTPEVHRVLAQRFPYHLLHRTLARHSCLCSFSRRPPRSKVATTNLKNMFQ